MTKEIISIHGTGSLPQYEHDGDDYDRYYLPARAIFRSLADRYQGYNSGMILPGNQLDDTLELMISKLRPSQPTPVYRTSDSNYLLWQDIYHDQAGFCDWIRQFDSNPIVALLPYASSDDYWSVFNLLTNTYQVTTSMDQITGQDWLQRDCFAHKGAYFNWSDTNQTPLGQLDFLSRPDGRVAVGAQELVDVLQARKLQKPNQPVVLKQIYGGGGYGIDFFDSPLSAVETILAGDYQIETNPYLTDQPHPILVQDKINLKTDDFGEIGLSVQFEGNTIRQLTRTLSDSHGHWHGNILLTPNHLKDVGINQNQYHQALRMSQKLLKRIKPHGKGGIDYVISQSGEVMFMEVNGGRTTGAEEAVVLSRMLSTSNGIIGIRKFSVDPDRELTTQDIDERCLRLGIGMTAIDQSYGILPFICIGDHLSVLVHAPNIHYMNQWIERLAADVCT